MAHLLFPHNEIAYQAASSMLAESGKAAVIHPTGTGKSFIGFQLCADHSDRRICWLSPSEYIYETQKENWEDAGGPALENIGFFTYAKLMMMEETELAELMPDYIIMDEFHRCGAEMWGAGVERLLRLFPTVPLLGLTATNIRYLDNQRDMADELFDGNIASQMTLGEAVARGILNSPTYVLSIFAYQKDYDRLKARVRSAQSKAVRNEAERYLEALRRALEQADGLDTIFDKYMTDRTGKYLVFCANAEHMREMMTHVPEWFGAIDAKPHVYSAYSDDPNTRKAFRNFKEDNSSHLKLLFCIDMLNEGIHVEDVSGVILFRPTVSPIVFKQQIGRALSASKTKDPIIFDVVNNIENLYSIGTIQQEIQAAVSYYRFCGEGKFIVNERFKVVDELRDARELFEKLNDTLSASWDLMYEHARQYYVQHGDLNVSARYLTPEGYALGAWLHAQRKVYTGERYGNLSEDRIEKLNAIGMRWGSYLDQSWEKKYQAAKEYYEEHGDLQVKATEVTDDGIHLGAWLTKLRIYKKCGIKTGYLNPERIALLDQIGMVWDVPDFLWEENYVTAMQYYREHGDLDVPSKYVAPNGVLLGNWIAKLRTRRKQNDRTEEGTGLSQEQIERLDSIGMIWDSKYERLWKQGLREAKKYFEEHGDLNMSVLYLTPSGFKLGRWVEARRKKGKDGYSPEQLRELEAVGMTWQPPDSWEVRYSLAKKYYEEHGNLQIPWDYQIEGIWLGSWISDQRNIYNGNRPGKSLTQEQIDRLEAIGMKWGSRYCGRWSAAWEESFQDAKAYYETHGNLNVPGAYRGASGRQLSSWIKTQRKQQKAGKLMEEQFRLLDEIGMTWESGDPWETGFSHAEQYFKENGHLDMASQFVCGDGFRLGEWIVRQRAKHNNPRKYGWLTNEQIRRLESLGIVWSPSESKWQTGYAHAREYLEILDGEKWRRTYVSPDGFRTGAWIYRQMQSWKKSGMKQEQFAALRSIGLIPEERSTESVKAKAPSAGGKRSDLPMESRG